MKLITNFLLCTAALMLGMTNVVQAANSNKYREPDLRLSAYKIDEDYYGSLSGTVNVNENISIDATIETSGYLEIGTAYGDVFFERVYAEIYVNYGRSDTTDIYTFGAFSGLPITENILVFYNTAYDWRRSQDNFSIIDKLDIFDAEEWKNTVGLSYTVHEWVTLSSTYSVDYLNDTVIAVDDNIATSWDATLTFNVLWVSPYVKYIQGDYRVSPDQVRKSQDNVEIGINFNF